MLRLFAGTFCRISRSTREFAQEKSWNVSASQAPSWVWYMVITARHHGSFLSARFQRRTSMCMKWHYVKTLHLKESIHMVTLAVKTTDPGMILKIIIINQKTVKPRTYSILFYGRLRLFLSRTFIQSLKYDTRGLHWAVEGLWTPNPCVFVTRHISTSQP